MRAPPFSPRLRRGLAGNRSAPPPTRRSLHDHQTPPPDHRNPVAHAAALNPFLFSTKFYDAEVDLYYYGYRYLQPRTKRWLNRDPLGEAGGLNLYAFVANDPVNLIDALGLELLITRWARAGWYGVTRTANTVGAGIRSTKEGASDFLKGVVVVPMANLLGAASEEELLEESFVAQRAYREALEGKSFAQTIEGMGRDLPLSPVAEGQRIGRGLLSDDPNKVWTDDYEALPTLSWV